jgi:hypothetical protein
MAFSNPADRRIARHLTNVLSAERDQTNVRPTTGRGGRSLASGMTCAYNEDVKHGQALSGLGHLRKSS